MGQSFPLIFRVFAFGCVLGSIVVSLFHRGAGSDPGLAEAQGSELSVCWADSTAPLEAFEFFVYSREGIKLFQGFSDWPLCLTLPPGEYAFLALGATWTRGEVITVRQPKLAVWAGSLPRVQH